MLDTPWSRGDTRLSFHTFSSFEIDIKRNDWIGVSPVQIAIFNVDDLQENPRIRISARS